MENNEQQNADLLSEVADTFFEFTYATTGQRFLNFLIDNIVIRFTISYVIGFGVGFMLAYWFPDLMHNFIYERKFSAVFLVSYIIGIFDYIFYYTLMEKLLNGRTIGKLITGTRAVREDGHELTFKDALLRSLSRLIPFEVFSGFGVPWHDSLTHKMVVKK